MEHSIVILGILMSVAAIAAVVLRFMKQSAIIAYILVGVLAGLFKDSVHISHEMIQLFTELGIILLLFMAGIEIEIDSMLKRWKSVLGFGLGQIFSNLIIGASLAYFILDISTLVASIFFGLCLTLSSTIVVINTLKSRREAESYHGQIILGLMVLQDLTAVVALIVVTSLSAEGSLLSSIGWIGIKLLILSGVMVILAKYVLPTIFRFLANAQELLFIGSLGWVLGIAAVCEYFHFSPEIGAFMAGAALSALPYRLEIQDKVEPMKDFGIILFFVALGFNLDLNVIKLNLIPLISLVSAVVLFGTPLTVFVIGYFVKTKSRPTFAIGTIINQISEFSLILATLCVQAAIFDNKIFVLITLSTIITIFFSSFGCQFLESLYQFFRRPLQILDNRSSLIKSSSENFELKDHIVVVKYNELSERIIEYFTGINRNVLLIDIDPDVYDSLHGNNQNVACMYADFFDPDTRVEANFAEAHAIFSCLIDGQEAELGLLTWLKDKNLDIPFIAATDSRAEALELYDNGAAFVIQTEDLAADYFAQILEEHGKDLIQIHTRGKSYHQHLTSIKDTSTLKFM